MTGTQRAERRRLGSLVIEVSTIGLGGAPLSGRFGPVPLDRVHNVLSAAIHSGVTLFDTAARYAAGQAERVLGDYLARCPRESYVLCTKVTADPAARSRRDGVRAAVAGSLSRLGRDYIDIVLLHDPYDSTASELAADLEVLGELRADGVIGAVGIGIGDVPILVAAVDSMDVDCILLSGRFTLLDQSAASILLPQCMRRGIGVIAGSVFNSGVLVTGAISGARYDYEPASTEVLTRVERLRELCVRYGARLEQAALQFTLSHPAVSSVLVGTTKAANLLADIDAAQATVPDELWTALRDEKLVDAACHLPREE